MKNTPNQLMRIFTLSLVFLAVAFTWVFILVVLDDPLILRGSSDFSGDKSGDLIKWLADPGSDIGTEESKDVPPLTIEAKIISIEETDELE